MCGTKPKTYVAPGPYAIALAMKTFTADFEHRGLSNHSVLTVGSHDRRFEVTVQRVGGKTTAEVVAELTEERNRLRRVLACERGDDGSAPEGWTRQGAMWWKTGVGLVCVSATKIVPDPAYPNCVNYLHHWAFKPDDDDLEANEHMADTALEAMEAADLALRAPDNTEPTE